MRISVIIVIEGVSLHRVHVLSCVFTLLSGRLRIFFDAAGGHATADATAFIIFV